MADKVNWGDFTPINQTPATKESVDWSQFEPVKPSSAIRKLADYPLAVAGGAVGAVKAIADAAGAGNVVSGALNSANDGINNLLSPEAKAEDKQISSLMSDAQAKGMNWEGVKAGAKAFGVAPVRTALSGLGSVAPIVAGTALTGGGLPAALVGGGLGVAMGAGTAKGAIYDDIKKRSLEGGMDEAAANAAATKAQEYGGANTDQIALGGALGAADALTGVSKAASGMVRNAISKPIAQTVVAPSHGIIRRSAMGVLGEMPLEAAQGGQEQLAANIAAQRAGFDAGTWDNVASKATLEALASAGPGAAFGALNTNKEQAPSPLPEPTPDAGDPTVPPTTPPTIDFVPPEPQKKPEWTTELGASAPRINDGIDMPREFDTGGLSIAEGAQPIKASEAMGIDPAAGPLSKAAATAVDTGASAQLGSIPETYLEPTKTANDATNNIANDATNTPATSDIANQNNAGAPTFGSAYAQRQASAPAIQSTDILNAEGKPFLTGFSAKKAATDAGEGYRPFKIGEKQFVVRYFEPENATKTIATQASSTPATAEKLPVLDQTTTALPQPKETNGTQTTEAVQAAQERPQAPIAEPLNVPPRTSDAGGADSAVTVPAGNRNLADSGWKMLPQRGKADIPTSPAAVPGSPETAPKADLGDLTNAKDTAESLSAQTATQNIATNASNTTNSGVIDAVKPKQLYVEFGGKRYPVDSVQDAGNKWGKFKEQSNAGASEVGNGVSVTDENGKAVASISYNGRIWAPDGKEFTDAPLAPQIAEAAHEAATSPKNDLPEPTQAQKEAGNYKKGHTTLHGLDISIENPVGSKRSGTDAKGKKWSNTMRHHYGYFKGTVGMDKDHIDTFIGDKPESQKVFVVDQIDPATGKPDEHKVMLGFETLEDAQKAYQANYAKGWKGAKATTETTIDEFKKWLKDGNTKKPFAVPAGLAKMRAAKAKKEAEKSETTTSAKPTRQDAVKKAIDAAKEVFAKGGTEFDANRAATDALIDQMADTPDISISVDAPAAVMAAKATSAEPQPTVTPPEIRAEQMRQQKIKTARGSNLKAIVYKKSPFLAFLGKHGVLLSEKNEFSPDKNPFLSGYGPMFRRNGLPIDLLVARAVEDGFLPQGTEDDSSLRELITRQIRGDSIAPLYTEDGASDFMQAAADAREADYQDYLEAIKTDNTPFVIPEFTELDWETTGYTDLELESQQRIQALLAEARDKGIDAETLLEDIQDETREQSNEIYYEKAIQFLEQINAQGTASRSENAGTANTKAGTDAREDQRRQDYLESIYQDSLEPIKSDNEPSRADNVLPSVDAVSEYINGRRDTLPSDEEIDRSDIYKSIKRESRKNADVQDVIPKSDALNEKEKAAKAKMLNALGKLATLASKNTRMNWTPEEEQKLLPIVIELFDGAMELGAVTFQKAVKYVRDYIAQGIDQETADAIPFDTLQGAYIATSGRHKDKGVTPKKEVASFESLAELEAEAKPSLTDTFYDAIKSGNMPKDNPALRKMVETFDGKPADNARLKEAQEELEAAIARTTRDVIAKNLSQRDTFDALLKLYNSQPLLNIRTSTSIANQAYSTPAPLAYLASELAGITKDDTVLEPTGGTGMLIAGANPSKTLANELNDHRAELLRAQGFTVTQDDAANGFKGTFDKVNTNPPFGSIKDDKGNVIKVPVDGYRLGRIDHLIAARALAAMKEDGKATLILGANKVAGGISNDDLIFFNWLYGHYNVTGHFEVEGDLYARQGAGWPVRVISINGRQKSNKTSPIAGAIKRADNWSQVYEYFNDSLATSRTESNPNATPSTGSASASETTTKPVPANTGKPPASANQRRPAGSAGDNGNVAGTTTRTVPDSAESAGNPMGASADTKRLNAAASESDRLDAGGDTMGRRADKPANTTGATALSSGENQFQTKYVPRSSRKDEGVLIPVNMKDPTQDALSKLEDAVGNIDDYAVKELGYANTEELHDALMGLQVDSVASAIYQIKQGNGIVIADQTGIGKGRQAAAIIRWAEKQGHIPIFVTVKPSLFTDMYGDLADIGTNDINPFIMNGSEWISGANGEKLFANKPLTHKNKLNTIAATGELPTGSNALFMTYSQINVDNVQRKALTALTDKAVFILDESHNAGGASATGEFITSVLGTAKGVTYLSATYAKRPDNMPLYFKTDIGKASADNEGLMNAMAAGGLPLQTVVSNNLVKAGQMFRRERSFDGIVFETKIDSKNKAVHEALSDKVTAALRSIVAADAMFHEVYVKELSKQLAKEGSRAIDNAGNQAQDSVQHTEFSSVVHNFVRQMLLGLKAQSAADDAIAALKRGEKPIIAVENTMGSFLNEYAAANSVIQGGSLGSFDYRTVLSRALARTRVMTEQKANGEKVKKTIPLSSLDGMTQAAYAQAQDVIDGLDLDIPVSPIDWMRYQIQKAGYSVSEITGRALSVDYSTPLKPTLSAISAQEQNDKVQTTRLFNSGKLDALILNVAGSTGISLHASEKFADKRQRHMIVAQPAQDINIFMQMLGRPHRTGQVIVPKYSLLGVDLPTEKRPTALLSKKMKSLNANTSSNTESATSVNTADMLNKYGDQIVGQYLHDNYHLAQALGIEAVTEDGDAVEDIARKATGRLALQPISVQNAFYSEVEGQYNALLDYLNKTNQNDLEPRTFDFDAKELRQEILFEGADKNSPFGEDAIYGEYSIKAQGLPMKPDEINAEIQENLGGKTSEVHILELSGALSKQFENFYKTLPEGVQQETARKVLAEGTRFLQDHRIGKTFRVDINGDTFNAVVTNIRSTHKNTGNPLSLSKVQVSIAVNGALRHISVPATQFQKIEVSTIGQGYTIEQLFKEQPTDQRETAKIVTGNLLAAYGEIDGARGTIISFTKTDGTTEQGILLPKTFDFTKNTRGDYRLPTGEMALKFLQESDNNDIGRFGIMSRDSVVRVLPNGKGIAVQVQKSKLKGGKYFLDKGLIGVLGDFVTAGSYMKAKTDKPSDAISALELLMKKQALYALPSMAEEAKTITDKPAFSRAQTETPAFKTWFGDSKVVDDAGKPLVVYHGTQHSFDTFDGGAFFTDDYMNADGYASGENVVEAFIRLERPLVINARGRKWDQLSSKYGSSTRQIIGALDLNKYDGVVFENIKDSWIDDAEMQTAGTVYFVANPNQIKSATDNNGNFDASNPDIRYSQGKKSDVLSKDGKFKGWPKFNEWTRAEYNDVVNLLPKEYRDDSHRREPIAAEDWDALATAVIPKLQEINQGKASFSLDKIGNILVNAQDVDISTILGKAKDIADQHDIGIYVTGNLKHHIAQLQQAGFESELGLAAVLQRAANTVYAPMPKPNIVRDGVGAIMSYKPRGFSQVLFTRFQQEQKVSGLPASKVQSIVDTLKSKWAAAPDIVVASTMNDAAIPQSVRDYNDTQLSQGATGAPEGFFYGGKVYLIADQLPTAKDVHRVLFHETLGHVGLRGAFGESLTPILKQIAVMRKAEVTAKAKEYGLDMAVESQRLQAAEEVLAVMAQTKPELGFVKRAIAAIRNWLRTHGIVNFGVSDSDIIANYILPARRFVEAGTKTKINETGLLNSLKAGNWYSELSRQVMASKTNAMPAGMWAGWIGSLTKKGVKPDEIEWSGVQDWLKMQTGKVTKDDVMNYLDQNGVQVEETVLGDMSPDETGETAKRAELAAMSDEELADEAESAGVGYDVYSPDASREDAIDDIIEAYMEGGAEADEVTKAKYSQYTLPGGTNYREVLLTLPIKSESQSYYAVMEKQTKKYGSWMDAINNRTQEETNELRQAFEADNVSRESLKPYKSSHWDKPNVLAHIRLNDRTDADGSRVLFVEEIQSDWGQDGKKKGFGERAPKWEVFNAKTGEVVSRHEREDAASNAAIYPLEDGMHLDWRLAEARGAVPTAPFVTATDKWLSLALKRVVKIAVDGGYDRVAFVNGEQSAERYDLSKQVDRIVYQKTKDGHFDVVVTDVNDKDVYDEQSITIAKLEEVLGKEIAKKMDNFEGENTELEGGGFNEYEKVLSGDGLKVGGEGMKAFYDKIIPNTAKDVIRKLGGGAIEEVLVRAPNDGSWGEYVGPQPTADKVREAGFEAIAADMEKRGVSFGRAVRSALSFTAMNHFGGRLAEAINTTTQSGFTITESMKEKASGGMPLFARENAQQTESAAFKKWFGDSKVVDARGKPLVVYHSTSEQFTVFDKEKIGSANSSTVLQGFYFADRPLRDADKEMAVYLSLKNPIVIDVKKSDFDTVGAQEAIQHFVQNGTETYLREYLENYRDMSDDEISEQMMEWRGADGAILKNTSYDVHSDEFIVFNPAQIKSATSNNGAFNASNPDIRFSRTDDLLSAYTPEQIKEKQAQEAEALKRESETVKAPQKKVTADQIDLFNPQGALFSRATTANLKKAATDKLNEHFSAPGKLSWWHKSIGTMYNLAERSPEFKPVFDAAQGFINDVSYYATEAADEAPKILPKMENWRDLAKSPISATDNKAISAPIFEGTLTWARDEAGKPVKLTELEARYANLTTEEKGKMLLKKRIVTEDQLKKWMASPLDIYDGAVRNRFESAFLKAGVVWSDAELKSIFNQTPEQISLYKEFRAATDKSLDNMAKAEMLRFGGDDIVGLKDAVMDAKDADEAGMLLRDYLLGLAEVDTARKDALMESANGMVERADKVNKLKAEGYAPLSRFGKYSIDVVVDGERQYFGLHETIHEANKMAAKMRAEFGAANVSQGTLSEDQFKMFSGITPETLELFGNMLGFDSTGSEAQDKAFQTYLKLTKNNNSAMRRLIHRKGIMGFSEDAGRVLASFVYSNARNTSAALNMGNLGEAVNNIPKNQGELKDAAIGLAEYIKNPQEEAQAIRGLLFAQYLGGSIASAFVNLTQPFAVSFPWLSQFGGATQSGAQLVKAMKDMANKSTVYEPDLVKALKHAEESGIVSPQEIHQLMAQARGAGTLRPGDGTKVGDAYAKAANTMSKLSLGWGKVFGMAEQLNRRSTFIAAYRIAKAQNMANPAAFAEKAVNETQFVYSKASKMRFGRGAVGGTLMTFKTYSIAYLELLHRMYTQGGPEGKKAVLLAMGVMMLMSGAGGLPFEDDILDLIDGALQKLGYNINSKKAKQQYLEDLFGQAGADFVERGISGLPGMPLDVSGRLGMGNLIPGTGLFKQKTDHTRDYTEMVGPIGDLAKRGVSSAGKLFSGDVKGAALEIAPTAVRNLQKGADMAMYDQYRDAKGYKVIETTPLEAALKAIGFQPATVAKVQESTSITQQTKDFYNQRTADIRAKWAKGIAEKDPEQVKSAREEMASWNEKNPDQKMSANLPAIWKKVREMQKTKEQRLIDTAPKAMRMQLKRDLASA